MYKILLTALLLFLSHSSLLAEPTKKETKVIGNYELVKSAIVRNWSKHPDYKKIYSAGTLVKIKVRCTRAGTKPLVSFYFDKKVILGDLDATNLVSAHLGSHHEDLSRMVKDKLYEVDAIIVNGGAVCYAAYWLHVEKFKEIKEKSSE